MEKVKAVTQIKCVFVCFVVAKQFNVFLQKALLVRKNELTTTKPY